MKKTFKKLTAAFIAAAMAVTALPQTALAESDDFLQSEGLQPTSVVVGEGDSNLYEGFRYKELEDGTLSITGYEGTETKVTIPSQINGQAVTVIGKYAFSGNNSITKIIIPDGVITIGEAAFWNCTSMTAINLPNSVTTIGKSAFYCSLLKQITIPDSVTTIEARAFGDCRSLTEIYVDKNNKSFCSIDGVLFNKDVTTLIQFPIGNGVTSYVVPDGVTIIGEEAFYHCSSLTKIHLPDGVTTIGNFVLADCPLLTEITLPNSLTTIGEAAFSNCSSMTEINVDENNKNFCSIDGVLFNKDVTTLILFPESKDVTSYTVPDGVATIEDWAFDYCSSLIKINLPESLTTIGKAAFYFCTSLTEITIPDSVTTIGERAFCACISLTEITIPDSITTIWDYTFELCLSLTKINLPEGVTTIGNEVFSNCNSLTEIILPDNVTTIGDLAFACCPLLTEIILPDGLKIIGAYAFEECHLLTKIIIPASVTDIGDDAFYDCPDDLTVYVYINSYAEAYANENNIKFVYMDALTFTDEDTGIEIDAGEDALPADTKLTIEQTAETDTEVSFDITLTCNGEEIQPEGNVTVRIPVPEGWDIENIYVYHRDANGKLTEIKAAISGGYIIFTTNHFSEYLLSTTKLVTTTPCDVDGSGEVDELDSVALARYLASWDVSIDQSAADVDGNGDIDELDSVMLARKLAGWNV